ncbi:MAG: hypothetical protein ACXWKC_08930 [Xanthobacteraceae bacterium]
MSDNAHNDNGARKDNMRIYIFKSKAKTELRAFTDDLIGSKLPGQFAPWLSTGTIAPGNELPHGFARGPIEKAISDIGFQIWRLKPAKAKN